MLICLLVFLVSCNKYDPRCLICDAQSCLECADPLLNSVRRSGARALDTPLPFDELTREFSFKFSYGSQHPRVFDEAEAFFLMTDSSATTFLNESSKTCSQGLNGDATWSCKPFAVSHRVCGHNGVFSFGSPIYAIAESAQSITLTVQRSGGGMGSAAVAYDVQYLTASPSDVSPTAFYTSSQLLVFGEGVVELAFQLTIHDDHVVEQDETFRVTLRIPEFETTASLGNQCQALVTILDDDAAFTDASLSYVVDADNTLKKGGKAGSDLVFKIKSILGSGSVKSGSASGDVFLMESYAADIGVDLGDDDAAWEVHRSKQLGKIVGNGDSTYTCTWQCTQAGNFNVAVYLLYSGGLRGDYYDDAWLGENGRLPPAITRIDHQVSFTWGNGPLFPGASDYVSVRWSGLIKPKSTGEVTFYVAADDQARLWIGDFLLIDKWDDSFTTGQASATITLDSSLYYSIVLDYRDFAGNAQLSLSWSSASLAKEIIPALSLFSVQHIRGSPFQNVTISPATANVHTSTIQGVLSSVAGITHSVKIFPMDMYGNPRRVQNDSTDLFEARMTLTVDQSLDGVGSKQNDALIVWNPVQKAFRVSFTPLISGIYDLDVWINTVKLDGSPFQMTVTPGAMHPTRSIVSGNGLLADRVAGVATTLLVEARDINNNRIYIAGSALLSIRAFHTTQLSAIEVGSVADNGDGTYTLSYSPRIAGSYNVRVLLNGGVDVNNSPYLVSVVPNVPMGTTSTAAGTGLASASTNVQASFQVTTRDLHKNDVKQGGASFQVTVEHPTKGNVAGSCSDLLTGLYACVYTAKYVGASKLHVILTHSGVSLPISGSPFALNVVAGPALGSFSLAQGAGLVSTIAGVRVSFTVFVRDAFNNEKRNAGQETITVVFKGPAPATTTVVPVASTGLSVTFSGDDKFLVSYALQTKGKYTIQVQVNGVNVVASPFTIYTYPAAASPVTTSLDLVSPVATANTPVHFLAGALITTRITTRDAFGNVLESGGYSFQIDEVRGFQANPISDAGNGSYSLLLRPLQTGVFPFEPKVLLTGGLNGTYFPTPDLTGSSILKRQDPVIDVDFNVTPPTQTDAMKTFSVRWNGFLLPAYSEMYKFDAEVLGGVSLSVNNIPLLGDLWPEANITHSKQQTQVYLVANQFVPIELNFSKPKSIPNGKVRLSWQSLSQKREVVPTSRLFTSWRIVNNVPSLEIFPAIADPPSFTAEFVSSSIVIASEVSASSSPTIRATAGATFRFQVIARDQFANKRLTGGDTVHILFPQLADAVNPSPIAVVNLNNAVYDISFSPILSGTFSMVVAATTSSTTGYQLLDREALALFLRPYYIRQSPFTFIVEPNVPLSTTSTITGIGFFQATAGVEASFAIQLRDLNSNAIDSTLKVATGYKVSLPRVQLRIGTGVSSTTVEASLSRSQDGTVKATYTATRTGLYQVMLSCDGGVTFTSKSSTLRVFPNIASALTSTITGGTGLGPQIQVNKLVTYSVSLRDFYSNSMEIGGDDLIVVFRGPEIVYPTTITDLSTANYVVAYQVSLSGSYEIQTQLASHDHGLLGSYFTTTRFSASSVAAVQAIDANVNFDWQANETMRNYPRIQWKGFLKPKYTEIYKLHLKVRPFGAVYIDQVPVIDALNTPLPAGTSELTGQVNLIGGRLHAITIEYRSPSAREVFGFVSLLWESDRQRLEVVPSTAFFPSAQEIYPRYTVVAV